MRIVIWFAYLAAGATALGRPLAVHRTRRPHDLHREPGDAAFGDALLGAQDAAREARALHGLDQVVHGLEFERRQRELGVRGHEDHVGQRLLDLLHDLDATAAGNLDVHEHEIGPLLADLAPRLGRGRRFADDFDVVFRGQQCA